jgi:hypothetical protein
MATLQDQFSSVGSGDGGGGANSAGQKPDSKPKQTNLQDVFYNEPNNPKGEGEGGASAKAGAAQDLQGSNKKTELPTWMQQLPKEAIGDPDTAGQLARFSSIGELSKAYIEAQKRSVVPDAEAKPEEVERFYQGLGKPKEPSGYSFHDKDSKQFADLAYKLNLTEAQAAEIWNSSKAQLDGALKTVRERQNADFEETDKLLRKEYPEPQKYEEAIAFLQRGLGNGGLDRMLREAGLAGKPEIVRAFIELGRATSEAGLAPAGSGSSSLPKSIKEGRGFSYN